MSTVIATGAATASAGLAMVAAASPPRIAVLGSVAIGDVFGFFYAVDTAPTPKA